jgi:tRNA uridine 5-carboxymethylaminomethyl modification enzyme
MSGEQFTAASPLTGAQLLKRSEVTIEDLMEWIGEGLGFVAAVYDRRVAPGFGPSTEVAAGLPRQASNGDVKSPLLSREEARRIETDFKYEGYLQQQERQMERMKRAESRRIPDWFDYRKVSGLSREVTEKLTRVRPLTLGQASRIPGITPAAVSLVNCYIEIFQRRAAEQASV